ncbi:DUF3509 domain-containing protein [Pseudomonas sp. No.21]|jgi:hypothetical protein|uniref:DUF3509 domain-containing protein n=1 Tax=Pseudomonas tohonis TaxID=2725477 RepID=A0A6J4E0U4_9PSED|nr:MULTISPECIES: DUF3509 domain-containing protein [Pseudomonas]MDW3711841.1 DUF3509 domain-containing protein [Pseudomonas sp. 2023EL-01195]PZE14001.1 hypothetical protein DMX10_08300 [Pseudomonas sp. 57B-090624]UXY54388.1 DUF3509 domain-containing protein [Pseudomonas tohonis]BBP81834.1 hypothetical protein PHLH8_14760 [Pseudomonas sp. Pc102]BCG23377.1 hypothetical protein TUM18999_15680 [Pseudomonas tohonis]
MGLDIKKLAKAFPDYEFSAQLRPDGGYVVALEKDGIRFQRVVPALKVAEQLEWTISTIKRDMALELGEVPPVESLKNLHKTPLPRYFNA